MKPTKISVFSIIVSMVIGAAVMKPVYGSSPQNSEVVDYAKSPQYSVETKRFINRQQKVLDEMHKEAMSFSTFLEWFKGRDGSTPSVPLPEVKPNMEEFLKPSKDLKVIWFGHSSFLLNFSGKIILVDPVFSGNASPVGFFVKRFQPAVLTLEELPKIDLILISHDHYDNLDKTTMKYFAKKDNKFVVPLAVSSHLVDWGVDKSRITELDWWQSTKFEGIELIATPAQHFSGRSLWDSNKTLWASWVLRNESHNIFYSGDTGYDIHFKEIGDKYGPFDIAFIENSQYNEKWKSVHQMPGESIQAYLDLKAKKFFPVHWGMFVLAFHTWREPADELLKRAEEKGVNLVTPKLGEIVTVSDDYRNTVWWQELK